MKDGTEKNEKNHCATNQKQASFTKEEAK